MIICHFFSNSQDTWFKTYDAYNLGNEIFLNIIPIKNGYFLNGIGFKIIDSTEYFGYNLFGTDKAGNVIWKKFSTDYYSSTSVFSDENIYIWMSKIYGDFYNNLNHVYDTQMYIYVSNEKGDSIDMIKIIHDDSLFISSNHGLTRIRNKFYLLANIWSEGYPHPHPKLLKINDQGIIEKEVEFRNAGDEAFYENELIKTPDDNLLLYQERIDTANREDKVDYVAYVYKYDTLLNEISTTKTGYCDVGGRTELNGSIIARLIYMSDGGFAVNYKTDTSGFAFSNVAKFDRNGGKLWQKDFVTFYGRYLGSHDCYITYKNIYALNSTRNGDMIGGGNCYKLRLGGIRDSIRYLPWIFRLDPNGELLWERYLMLDYFDISFSAVIYDILETEEGNIVISGGYSDGNVCSNCQFGFIAQLTSDGCFTPGCDSLTFLTIQGPFNDIEEINPTEGKILIYPNPATDYLFFSFEIDEVDAKYEIFDIMGYKVAEGFFDGLINLETGHYRPGIYFVRIVEKNKIIATGKFIKE